MIPTKVELMRLVFMVSRFLIGFYRVDVDNKFLTNASGGDPRGDLRTVCCSEIYPALNLGAIQCSLVSEPALVVVVTLCSASQPAARTTG